MHAQRERQHEQEIATLQTELSDLRRSKQVLEQKVANEMALQKTMAATLAEQKIRMGCFEQMLAQLNDQIARTDKKVDRSSTATKRMVQNVGTLLLHSAAEE